MLTAVAAVLADQPVDLDRRRGSTFQLDLVRCLWVVLPGAILWGASFPLALARWRDAARIRRGWSAASTPPTRVGAIVGALVASLMLVVWLGSQHAQQVLIIVVRDLSALLMLAPRRRRRAGAKARFAVGGTAAARRRRSACAGLLVADACRRCRGILVAYGRYAATRVGQADIIYVGEGLNASVAVSRAAERRAATTTTPARCRRRASRRTCACSACSAT